MCIALQFQPCMRNFSAMLKGALKSFSFVLKRELECPLNFCVILFNAVLFDQVKRCATRRSAKNRCLSKACCRSKRKCSFKEMFQHLEHFTFLKAINAPNLMRSQLHSLVSLWKIRALSSNYSHNLKLKGYFRSKLFGIFISEIFRSISISFVLGSTVLYLKSLRRWMLLSRQVWFDKLYII